VATVIIVGGALAARLDQLATVSKALPMAASMLGPMARTATFPARVVNLAANAPAVERDTDSDTLWLSRMNRICDAVAFIRLHCLSGYPWSRKTIASVVKRLYK